jgi:2-phospho-L-lactate guanylyltransferase
MSRLARPWAVVPVKRFTGAKSRLAGVLAASERAIVAQTMFLHVLDVLSGSASLAGVAVVTEDEDAARAARTNGALVISRKDQLGLNGAIAVAFDTLHGMGVGSAFAVSSDLPLICAADVDGITRALRAAGAVLVEARADGGTNVFGTCPPGAVAPAYGVLSFRRHLAMLRGEGFEPEALAPAGLTLDLDTPDDISTLVRVGGDTPTHQLLAELGFVGATQTRRTNPFPLEPEALDEDRRL